MSAETIRDPMPRTPAELAAFIDHTLLKPQATPADIVRLCREATLHRFASVCINPVYVAEARRSLDGTSVAVCTVIGFPLGAATPSMKIAEAREAIADGATEIDMVIHVGAMKAGEDARVRDDVAGVVAVARSGGAVCKVILETCLLSTEEKGRACRLCIEAGADFVKTSTGFSTGGATAEDVALMAGIVRPAGLRVKASGGVRTIEDARRMIAAGASRIGTSSGVDLVRAMSGGSAA